MKICRAFLVRGQGTGLHPAVLSSYIGSMQEASPKPNHKLYGGVAASIVLHVIIAVALFARLPAHDATPPTEETVTVEIVAPPDEPKPDQKAKQEELALNLMMPRQKQEEERQPPPPPKQEVGEKAQQPASSDKEKQPDTQEVKQMPPLPPKEKAKEEEKAPPPPAEKLAEQKDAKAELPPQSAEQKSVEQQSPPAVVPQAEPASMRALNNTFRFGDKDSTPHKSPDGNAAQDSGESGGTTKEENGGEAQAVDTKHGKPTVADQPDMPPGSLLPPDISLPDVNLAASGSDKTGSPEAAASDANAERVAALPPSVSKSKPVSRSANAAPSDLIEVKTLFSQKDGGEVVAMTAMGNLPRNTRVAQLCSTELKMQLRHANHWPDMLPSQGLTEGTLLDIPSAAFHDGGQWYDVSYRCEIDQGATKVVSFAMKLGNAIPRNQWKERGLPVF